MVSFSMFSFRGIPFLLGRKIGGELFSNSLGQHDWLFQCSYDWLYSWFRASKPLRLASCGSNEVASHSSSRQWYINIKSKCPIHLVPRSVPGGPEKVQPFAVTVSYSIVVSEPIARRSHHLYQSSLVTEQSCQGHSALMSLFTISSRSRYIVSEDNASI